MRPGTAFRHAARAAGVVTDTAGWSAAKALGGLTRSLARAPCSTANALPYMAATSKRVWQMKPTSPVSA